MLRLGNDLKKVGKKIAKNSSLIILESNLCQQLSYGNVPFTFPAVNKTVQADGRKQNKMFQISFEYVE